MNREIYKSSLESRFTESYITVGDTIGDKTITEIWCTSLGNVRFTVDNEGNYYSFKELLNLLDERDNNRCDDSGKHLKFNTLVDLIKEKDNDK